MLPADFEFPAEHALCGYERWITKDRAYGTAAAAAATLRGQVHEKKWERRGVRGEEAVARKGGFGNKERDGRWGWGFLRLGRRGRCDGRGRAG